MERFGRKRKGKSCLGVDIGNQTVKAVEVRLAGNRPEVMAEAEAPTPPVTAEDLAEEALTETLLSLKARATFRARQVATALRGTGAIERIIKMPLMPKQELESALCYEAEELFPFPLNEVSLRHVILGKKEKQQNVLLVAAPLSLIYKYHRAFTKAGLPLAIIDLPVLALWRLLYLQEERKRGVLALLDIGARVSRFLVADEDRSLLYLRSFPLGVLGPELPKGPSRNRALTKAPEAAAGAEELSFNQGQQENFAFLGLEVRRSVEYFRSQYREKQIEGLFLTGGGSLVPGLPEMLKRETEIPLEKPGVLFPLLGKEKVEPSFAVALGLALGGVLA